LKIPFDAIAGVVSEQKKSSESSRREIRLSVMVLQGTSKPMVSAARRGLYPATPAARLHVEGVGVNDPRVAVNSLSDAAVVLVGPGSDRDRAVSLWRDFAGAGVRCCVAGAFDDGLEASDFQAGLIGLGIDEGDLLLELDAAAATQQIGDWLVGALSEDLAAAAAANFACCRAAQAQALVRRACGQNAAASLLGALPMGQGADIVVMTATQVSLALQLASLYGHPLDASLAREIVPVIAGAPVWRGVARSLIARTRIPPFVVRAGVGAGGTYAVGRALVAVFESDADVAGDGAPSRLRTGAPVPVYAEVERVDEGCVERGSGAAPFPGAPDSGASATTDARPQEGRR
jgi:uncharacterized protein (DUF697 family)